jgi:hypothetical protein
MGSEVDAEQHIYHVKAKSDLSISMSDIENINVNTQQRFMKMQTSSSGGVRGGECCKRQPLSLDISLL